MINLLICGCIFNDELSNKLSYTIVTENQKSINVTAIIYINDGKIDELNVEKNTSGRGISTSEYRVKPGKHKFEVIIKDDTGSHIFNKSLKVKVNNDFKIDILIKDNDLEINVIEEKPERKNNHAPKMKEGKYVKLNNTTYRFSVIYIDEDNDEPTEAKLFIDHKYYDEDGDLRSKDTIYHLEYKEGNYKSGALFEIEITEFSEDDDFRFAFLDGYAMAHPLDDTPYTDP
jgi:hypothetical protein